MAAEASTLEPNRLGANLIYVEQFLAAEEATQLMQRLLSAVAFDTAEQSRVRIHGRWLPIPRQQTAYGDPGTSYRFSGCTVPARPWIEPLTSLRRLLLKRQGIGSNFVLINHYRNGADSIGWHADDERDLGAAPTIASLSLGAARAFQLRRRQGSTAVASAIHSLVLAHGSLLIMRDPTNKLFNHQLPKAGGQHSERIGPRLNLTWRMISADSW